MTPLGELLDVDIDAVQVDPTESYPFAGVYGFGRGLFVRGSVKGTDTTYSHFHRLHEGQLVMSQPKGWEGAITVVPKEFEGRFLSSVFPTFRPCDRRLSPAFLRVITKCKWLWDSLLDKSSGIGARRNSIYSAQLLEVSIPLPPLSEQERLVIHIDRIEAHLVRAERLRAEIATDSLALLRSLIHEDHCKGVQPMPLRELLSWRQPDIVVSQTESYTFAGVYSFGRGVFKRETMQGIDFAYDRLTRLRVGEFTYPKLMAWEGALGVVPPECDGCHVSPEFAVFSVDESRVLPEILDIHFKTPTVWKALAALSPGTNVRRRRLNPRQFLDYRFPLPPMEAQLQAKRVASLTHRRRHLEAEATKQTKALLPSLLDYLLS